jgi:hypothetical protein
MTPEKKPARVGLLCAALTLSAASLQQLAVHELKAATQGRLSLQDAGLGEFQPLALAGEVLLPVSRLILHGVTPSRPPAGAGPSG